MPKNVLFRHAFPALFLFQDEDEDGGGPKGDGGDLSCTPIISFGPSHLHDKKYPPHRANAPRARMTGSW
nr:hypothetical protein CFP56_37071 [Quercus suber]